MKKLFKKRRRITLGNMKIGPGNDLILLGKENVAWLRDMQTATGAALHHLEPRDDGALESYIREIRVDKLSPSVNDSADQISSVFTTLDEFWSGRAKQISLLVATAEVDTLSILRRSPHLISHGIIDYLFFTEQTEEARLGTITFLTRKGYSVFGIKGDKVYQLKKKVTSTFANFLAVNDRLTDLFLRRKPSINLFVDDINRHGIALRGVLHLGAHSGSERAKYRQLNISPVVFVEANPTLASSLRQKFSEDTDVKIVEAAASNSSGRATFNVTSMDQSSSLLDLKRHAELYPSIAVEKSISVETKTIDQIVRELDIEGESINLLVMDIQGAELLALEGASNQLNYIDAIQLEVNYSELYEGCPLIYDLDQFLYRKDFVRVRTSTPFSPEWGDALYVKRPKVTFSELGNLGRFANQAFQYMFLHTYAEEMGYRGFNPSWAGDQIFHVKPGSILPDLPFSKAQTDSDVRSCSIANSTSTFPNTDFSGFFQYDMSYYGWRKATILKEFAFKDEFAEISKKIRVFFESQGGAVAAIHLRRGDYGYSYFFLAPNEWYIQWLRELKKTYKDLTVFIATDDLDSISPDFDEFNVVTANDIPGLEKSQHDFFVDFAAMVEADFLAIANSSFSFLAALLNENAKRFSRPSLTERHLVDFDPWDSEVLLRDRLAEDEGSEFLNKEVRARRERKRLPNRAKRAGSKLLRLFGKGR
jgi:FkbM family methyltransferase|nr:FkbM family methyltransferase [Neorhizobium tomejilense]